MTPYERARRAIWAAFEGTDAFDHGDMASGDLMDVLEEYLRREFKPRQKKGK
jgi:hypothetical protein